MQDALKVTLELVLQVIIFGIFSVIFGVLASALISGKNVVKILGDSQLVNTLFVSGVLMAGFTVGVSVLGLSASVCKK